MLKKFCFFLLLSTIPTTLIAETVKVGVIMPLTGNQAVFGIDAVRMLNIIAPDFNLKRKKFTFQFILEDGKCGIGNSASTAANKLIHIDKVRFLVLGCSGEVLQTAPIAEKAGVLAIGFAAGHPDIRDLGDLIFRTYVDLNKAVHLIAELMSNEIGSDIAILTEDSPFTIGIKNELLNVLGKRVVFYDDFHADETSFQSLLVKARAAKPRAYYLNTAGPRIYQNLYLQLRHMGIKEPVYSYHSPSDSDVLKNLGALQNEVKFVATPEVDKGSAEFEKFLESYIKKFPDGPNIDFLLRSSYDAVMSIVKGVENVGPDPKLVKQFLYTTKLEGAVGQLSFDEYGDIRDVNFTLKEIVNGVPKRIQSLLRK